MSGELGTGRSKFLSRTRDAKGSLWQLCVSATERKIRRGIYRSVAALRAEITSFIERHNADPQPFRWTKSADDILSSIERFCAYNLPAKL